MKVVRFLAVLLALFVIAAIPSAAAPLVGPCAAGGVYDPACDVDHNDTIDIYDIQLTAGHWNQSGPWTPELGAAPPCFDNANRYVDCGNGTVTDTVTGLIWLKDASCLGTGTYASANNAASGLQTGACGLTDNSSPGDWRLPTQGEWNATIARAVVLGCTFANAPSLTNTVGTDCSIVGPQPFTGVLNAVFWSSTVYSTDPYFAYSASLYAGLVDHVHGRTHSWDHIWPVRGGQ